MSDSSSSSSSGGVGVLGFLAVALTVLFVGLKVTGNITWAWPVVLSPILIYFGVCLFVVGLVLAVLLVVLVFRRD